MPSCDELYLDLVENVLHAGDKVRTRNAVCKRLHSRTLRFDSTPLVTTRKAAWKLALLEWEWFMTGSNDVNDLDPRVRHWWAPWADPEGKVANNYSRQLRYFHGAEFDASRQEWKVIAVDQIALLVDGVKNHPFSRRNVITTWNTAEMTHPSTPITNCHNSLTQAFVTEDNRLDLTTYQRSCDLVCGVPHNLIQMWAFLLWLARRTGREPGRLTWVGGDVHVYEQHYDLARRMLDSRLSDALDPRVCPNLVYAPTGDEFKAADFSLDAPYEPLITDKAEMVV
jgi:thymidylate synthase